MRENRRRLGTMELWHLFMIVLLPLVLVCSSTGDAAWTPTDFVADCDYVVPENWFCDPARLVQDTTNITKQLADVNTNTTGVINWDDLYYYGYIIAAAVVDDVQPLDPKDTPTKAVTDFGEGVQKAWFGVMICDNSTLILASLNTSKIHLFPGAGTDTRLRSHHKEACDNIHVDATNVEEALMACIQAYNKEVADAMEAWSNAAWGYGGVVAIMTMLIFHYWIKY